MAQHSWAVWAFAVVFACAVVVGAVEDGVDLLQWGEDRYELNYGVELSPAERKIPLNKGLAWGYYTATCATAQSIVNARVAAFLKTDPGTAAGVVRLIFHDCFVQGCDASILLKLSSGSELNAIPNLSIRAIALQLIDDIKTRIEAACPGIVSCADIIVMAAAQAITQVGGPSINVPLGRRDSLTWSNNTSDLPSPFTTFAQQSTIFTKKGLSTTDLVALVGAHTLGVAHCGSFVNRLIPTIDPKMNSGYANYLITNVCPTTSSTNTSGLDFYTPNKFDNQYFVNFPTGGALMNSDQNLDQNATALNLVKTWASNSAGFIAQFPTSFIKMSQIQTLTGTSGEIRKVCSTTNSGNSVYDYIRTAIPDDVDSPQLISMVVDGLANS